jgi:hypothetical protein
MMTRPSSMYVESRQRMPRGISRTETGCINVSRHALLWVAISMWFRVGDLMRARLLSVYALEIAKDELKRLFENGTNLSKVIQDSPR